MKTQMLLLLLIICHLSSNGQNNIKKINHGIYKQVGSSRKIELKSDGSYILYNPEGNGYYDIEQCTYSSKGKWKQLSNDVLEITSENYYLKQAGFEYELKKDNKLSQDSIYMMVNLPNNIPVSFLITFNNNVSKSVNTNKRLISLSKQKYLWPKTSNSINRNHIAFSLNANIIGTTLYKSRMMYAIFEEDIDTEKSNYLTVTLPNFDLCFFSFEPYNQELIFASNKNELMWQGKSWLRQP